MNQCDAVVVRIPWARYHLKWRKKEEERGVQKVLFFGS